MERHCFHLCAVHLPFEHRQGLECHGEVDRRDRLVDGNVVAVQIPVGVDVHDGLVVLEMAKTNAAQFFNPGEAGVGLD